MSESTTAQGDGAPKERKRLRIVLRWSVGFSALLFFIFGHSFAWRDASASEDGLFHFIVAALLYSPFILIGAAIWYFLTRSLEKTTLLLLGGLALLYVMFVCGRALRWTEEARAANHYVGRILNEIGAQTSAVQVALRADEAPSLLHGYIDSPPIWLELETDSRDPERLLRVVVHSDRYFWLRPAAFIERDGRWLQE